MKGKWSAVVASRLQPSGESSWDELPEEEELVGGGRLRPSSERSWDELLEKRGIVRPPVPPTNQMHQRERESSAYMQVIGMFFLPG
jgi:hypothetical protein